MKTKAFTLLELLVVCAIVALLSAIVLGGISGCSRSEGIRIGTVTKFSYKGNFWKSWEGELVMGGVRTSSNGEGTMTATANVWDFSVPGGKDSELAARIEHLSGKPVKLHYAQSAMHNPLARDTGYYITAVDDLSTTPEAK